MRLAEQAGFSEGLNQSGLNLAMIFAYVGALPRALEATKG